MSGPAPVKRAVIVGGGIAGLAAAHRFLEGARARNLPVALHLLEASKRFGGSLQTSRRAGCLLEHGPDCFLSTKPAGLALCRALGLESRLIGTNPAHRRSFLLRGGRLLPVPSGFYMLAPSSFLPLLTTPLFSPLGKLRMALDLVLPRRRRGGDETLAAFVRRRLGREALERMAQPMVAGIYSADPEELSLEATFPQFLEMEREERSLILALRRRMRAQRSRAGGAAASGPRYGLFLTLREGMEGLVEALLERIPEEARRTGSRAVSLRREGDRWRVGVEGGGEIEAEALCLACPAAPAGNLLHGVSPRLAGLLGEIPYGSICTLNLVFARAQVSHPLDGMGFVVPAVEGRFLVACTFASTKFEGRAAEGKVVLRAFFGDPPGGSGGPLPDEEMIARALEDLRSALGIRGAPETALLSRYPASMPQYRLGHLDRLRAIEEEAASLPGLALAGNAYRGVGIPDCAAGAAEAAERMLGYLEGRGAALRSEGIRRGSPEGPP